MARSEQTPDLAAAAEAVMAGETVEQAVTASANEKTFELPPLKKLLASIVMTLAGMFLVGCLLTTIATEAKQFRALPNKGSVQSDKEGNQYFAAQYPTMRRFTYVPQDGSDPYATEHNRLKDAGVLGTGFYMYSIANALHWSLEFQSSYIGAIVWIPFLVIAVGCSFFFFYFLPRSAQNRDSAIFFCTLFSGAHALIIIVLMFLSAGVSSSFGALYYMPVLNNGGQMIGLMLPGSFVLFMTNIFYGAVVGVTLSYVTPVVHFLRK